MSIFLSTLLAVFVLLISAVPGYLFIKRKMVDERFIPDLSKLLLYVCQSALVIYTFADTEFSPYMLASLGKFAIATLLIHGVMLLGAFLILRKKYDSAEARISTIAVAFANAGFFGIPIIEAVMGDAAGGLIVYTTVYSLVMNLLGWTVGSGIISKSRKYITVKKLFLNPYMISTLVAMPLFIWSLELPVQISSMVTILGKATSPVSMIIIGMRLATVDMKKLFTDTRTYLTAAAKLVVMPLVAFALIYFFPIENAVKATFFIITACPSASIVLNFSELIGEGQKEAVSAVLMSTILSVLTLPVLMLLLPFLM